MRSIILILACLFTVNACAPTLSREQVAAVLHDNPQLVFDALKSDKSQLLDVLDQAAQERDIQDRKDSLTKGIGNPLKPELAADRPFLGSADAPVTIVEYSDFLCGYCAQGAATIEQLMQRHPGQIRVFFKHYPAHPGSLEPASVFEALGLQDKSVAWKFEALAFANQSSLADGSGKGLAALLAGMKSSVKFDSARLKKDMTSPAMRERIESDVAEAKSFGVQGTPTFVVNGVLVRGALPIEEFEALLVVLLPKT
jgi:protein-disulfide isomerase